MKTILFSLCIVVACVKAFPRLKKDSAIVEAFNELFVEDKSIPELQAQLEEFLDEYNEYKLNNQQVTSPQYTTDDPSMFTSATESRWNHFEDQSTTDSNGATTTDSDLEISTTDKTYEPEEYTTDASTVEPHDDLETTTAEDDFDVSTTGEPEATTGDRTTDRMLASSVVMEETSEGIETTKAFETTEAFKITGESTKYVGFTDAYLV